MNKIILITGATSGFGEACARKFAAAGGYDIIITGRRKERLDTLKQELEAAVSGGETPGAGGSNARGTAGSNAAADGDFPVDSDSPAGSAADGAGVVVSHAGGSSRSAGGSSRSAIRVLPLLFDVQDKEAVFAAIGSLPPSWKQIDLLINNAGLALGRDLFEDASLDDWDTMIDTNIRGLLYVSKAVTPLLIARRQGHVINIGSIAGKEVYERGNGYCASKFAVDAISKAMRIDLLKHRIKVTAIHPGAADTEFSKVRFKGDESQAKKMYEGYTPLSAGDVADAIFYCASLPAHVCINELNITCTAQASSFYLYKES